MNKYQLAANQLLKGNIGNAITAMSLKSNTSELIQPSVFRNGNFFFGVNGADKAFIWGNFNSSLTAYQKCPVVSSIINKKAKCIVNAKRLVIDAEGKEVDTKEAKAIRQLLNKPNPIQSGMAFRAQGSVYRQIYGYCPILVIKPVGFENDISRWRLFNLPPWMLQLNNSNQLFYESDSKPFDSIRLSYMGKTTAIDTNAVFFVRENQISTDSNTSLFLPDSRLQPLEQPISNLIASLSSRGTLITERGPLFILSNGVKDTDGVGFPLKPGDIEKLETDFKARYGINRGQSKAIITDANVNLQTVGFDVAQLKLLEGEIQDAKHIADALDFPPYLMGLVDAKYDNQDIAERSLYTNSIIPDAQSEDEQLMSLLGLEKLGLRIVSDYSHLPAMQENEESRGRGALMTNQAALVAFINNIITWNEWRQMLSLSTLANMDKYYYQLIADGYVFGQVPNMSVPVDAGSRNQLTNSNQNSNG